ncbi:DUF6434 domain-containing protein [Winogradskyella flava]|uniref:DUF6434 domain-containing protein n=1 Tax=Winogradskyella flava TaxID=1884876 RepID=UPI0024913733|nr:DUF6434 domain-containing protein [Winogradskyella flava]
MKIEQRPKLTSKTLVKDFNDFYWYKEELVAFCRIENLNKKGSKLELAEQIEHYLSTGKKKSFSEKPKITSTFDWNSEQLYRTTLITDSYKNTENVRAFFTEHIGPKFKFNVKFMNWMKTAAGKSLEDAIEQWDIIASKNKSNKNVKQIAPQFEYNRYIRDFLKDNLDRTRKDAITCWKLKKESRGTNAYSKSDLQWITSI